MQHRQWSRVVFALAVLAALQPASAHAFCGFYVTQADAKLYNSASQVVIARDGPRTVVTMANDFRGDAKEFALVVPVPVVPLKEQIHVGNKAWIDHLDRYSAPRLVEYHDPDPCARHNERAQLMLDAAPAPMAALKSMGAAQKRGVTIEASYTVGEYDILILSAKESAGLRTWLVDNGYRVPARAERILGAYLKQGLKFFVAKVNLKEQARLGFQSLRPLQIAYESPRFMLPIRLGTVNADGVQELVVFTLTPKGRVETVNYRTVKIPTDVEVPLFVRADFGPFYRALFDRQVAKEGMNTVFLEYAWNAAWCDPCPVDPPSPEELVQLGVSWTGPGGSGQVFVTRLHARYDAKHFPEDLVFQETANSENFQGRYVLRNPWKGACDCDAAGAYRNELIARRKAQAEAIAALTGWSRTRIDTRMASGDDAYLPVAPQAAPVRWWQKLWAR